MMVFLLASLLKPSKKGCFPTKNDTSPRFPQQLGVFDPLESHCASQALVAALDAARDAGAGLGAPSKVSFLVGSPLLE